MCMYIYLSLTGYRENHKDSQSTMKNCLVGKPTIKILENGRLRFTHA